MQSASRPNRGSFNIRLYLLFTWYYYCVAGFGSGELNAREVNAEGTLQYFLYLFLKSLLLLLLTSPVRISAEYRSDNTKDRIGSNRRDSGSPKAASSICIITKQLKKRRPISLHFTLIRSVHVFFSMLFLRLTDGVCMYVYSNIWRAFM